MTTLIIPTPQRKQYPTLGLAICELMEEALLFGPGDLVGKPYRLDEEDVALICAAYEVYPRGHKSAGERCYDSVVWMAAKGTKKSERAAAVAGVELHPDGPVRFDHWQGRVPIGRPVVSPYIPITAYTESQAEDTSFSKLYSMLKGNAEHPGPHAHLFDIGLDRILRISDGGKAEALAAAPDSRDGGLTSFQILEETHRWTLLRQHEARATMSANLSKRPIAQPWELLPTTTFRPGEGSVAETLHDEAINLSAKPTEEQRAARLWFFYRWADERIKIRDGDGHYIPERLEAAVVDAIGPIAAKWKNPARLARDVPKLERESEGYGERVILNRQVKAGDAVFDLVIWKKSAKRKYVVPKKAQITLGGDGAKVDDAFAIIATELSSGFQFPLTFTGTVSKSSIWLPADFGGRVPIGDVDIAMDFAFTYFNVVRAYFDPPYIGEDLARWIAQYGDKIVLPWATWRPHPMGFACRSYVAAVAAGEVPHSGDPVFTLHIGNARKRLLSVKDNEGERLFTMQKDRDGSQHKMDAAMAGNLSWQARTDAVAKPTVKPKRRSYYEDHELAAAG